MSSCTDNPSRKYNTFLFLSDFTLLLFQAFGTDWKVFGHVFFLYSSYKLFLFFVDRRWCTRSNKLYLGCPRCTCRIHDCIPLSSCISGGALSFAGVSWVLIEETYTGSPPEVCSLINSNVTTKYILVKPVTRMDIF